MTTIHKDFGGGVSAEFDYLNQVDTVKKLAELELVFSHSCPQHNKTTARVITGGNQKYTYYRYQCPVCYRQKDIHFHDDIPPIRIYTKDNEPNGGWYYYKLKDASDAYYKAHEYITTNGRTKEDLLSAGIRLVDMYKNVELPDKEFMDLLSWLQKFVKYEDFISILVQRGE